jgi:hypothetical protein
MVESQKKGIFVEFQAAQERIFEYLHLMREIGEARLAEIRGITTDYLSSRGALKVVSSYELLQGIRGGEVTVLDVRPAEECSTVTFRGQCRFRCPSSGDGGRSYRGSRTLSCTAAAGTGLWRSMRWTSCSRRDTGLSAWRTA